MRIASKFDGTCSLCGSTWSVGDEIEYRKNCGSICTTCSASGRTPPEKANAPPTTSASASPASALGGSDLRALTDAANRIERVLAGILAEIRGARQHASPAAPPRSHAAREEGPF